MEKRQVNNPAHSKAVLNCSGNTNRPKSSRAEASRTTQWKSVHNIHQLRDVVMEEDSSGNLWSSGELHAQEG